MILLLLHLIASPGRTSCESDAACRRSQLIASRRRLSSPRANPSRPASPLSPSPISPHSIRRGRLATLKSDPLRPRCSSISQPDGRCFAWPGASSGRGGCAGAGAEGTSGRAGGSGLDVVGGELGTFERPRQHERLISAAWRVRGHLGVVYYRLKSMIMKSINGQIYRPRPSFSFQLAALSSTDPACPRVRSWARHRWGRRSEGRACRRRPSRGAGARSRRRRIRARRQGRRRHR